MLVDLDGLSGVSDITAAVVVPAQNPAPPPGRGEEFGKASPVGLVVIILLGLVTVLLIRSMGKRLRRLPSSFGSDDAGKRPAGDEPAPDEAARDKAGDGADAGNDAD